MTYTNQTENTAQVYSNQNIFISGTVNFNANITMTRCTVFMCPNAVLNVNGSTILTIQGNLAGQQSVVTGCTTMWQGININQNAALQLNNCRVRDGIDGIDFNPGFNNLTTRIENCSFEANQTAIQSQNTANFTFQAFSGNSFLPLRTPINGLFNGNDPNPLPQFNWNAPTVGISLNGVSGSIGTSGTQNVFADLSTGIRVENSTASVQNCRFSFNQRQDWNGITTGIGIWASNSSLTIQNLFSNNASCEFIQNNRGIRSDRTVLLNLQDAVFTDETLVDVEVLDSAIPNTVTIKNCTMNVFSIRENSISVQRSTLLAGNSINIRNNTINVLPAGFIWNNIRLIELISPPAQIATDIAYIADNTINCNHGNLGGLATSVDGIFVVGNSVNCQISGNTLFYNPMNIAVPAAGLTSVGIGFQFAAANPPAINGLNIIGPNNRVLSSLVAPPVPQGFQGNICGSATIGATRCSWIKCAIHVDAAPFTLVCSNEVDFAFQSYHFSGNLPWSEFGRNRIGASRVGANFCTGNGCGAATTFPDQDYRMNVWDGTNPVNYPFGSGNFPQPAMAWGPNNNWQVDPTLLGQDPTVTVQAAAPLGWYNPIPNGGASQTFCDQLLPAPPGFQEPPTGEIAKRLKQGDYQFTEPVQKWDFERILIGQMIRFPNSYANEPLAQTWLSENVNSPVGQIAAAEKLFADATLVGTAEQNAIEVWQTQAKRFADSLTLLEHGGLETEAVQAQKTGFSAQLNAIRLQIDPLNSTLVSLRQTHWQNTVRPFVDGLQTTNTVESNYKTFLKLQLKQLLNETITEADSVSIRQIAYRCRDWDGEVVMGARSMLPIVEMRAFPREGEDYLCNPAERNHEKAAQQPTFPASGFLIMPNPANESLSVQFENPFDGVISITDAAGRLVRRAVEKQISGQQINLTDFSTGLYWITVQPENGKPTTVKFNVIH